MADIVVVGAGLGGLATAARLSKLGHHIVVCERGAGPGGLLSRVRYEGFEWDATPMQTTVPAVLRDLFRKSGRPLERYVDLQLGEPARRHVFPDASVLDLPTGSRGGQLDAVSDALGATAGTAWTDYVDNQADTWERLRSSVLDVPDGTARLAERRVARELRVRKSLNHLVHKTFDDQRVQLLAAYPASRMGRSATDEPAFRAVESYLERTFGVWRFPRGGRDLAASLLTRLSERSVDLRVNSEVTALRTSGDRVVGVTLHSGEIIDADIVVTTVAPQQVFGSLLPEALSRNTSGLLAPSRRTLAKRVCYLGLAGEPPELPAEVVLHGDPLLVLSTGPSAGDGAHSWTVSSFGASNADVLATMAARGIDVRDHVAVRLDGGSPTYPLDWEGARRAAARAALGRPLPGLYCLGTGLLLGPAVPYVAWQAAHVAEQIGKA